MKRRIQRIAFTGTILMVGLLLPMSAAHAHQMDSSGVLSGLFKIEDVFTQVQTWNQDDSASRVERPRSTEGPVQILQRRKLGNYIEDVDFVPNGAFANQIVMIAGYEVFGVAADANSDRAIRKLFDVRGLGVAAAPNGIAYVASERLFALVDDGEPTTLFVCDHQGKELPRRTIRYLNGYRPRILEGLAYLPPESPHFPDHLVMVTSDFFDFRLEVIRLNGQVEAEIPIPREVFDRFRYVASVAFAEPDHLLIGTAGEITALDFAGNVAGGPVTTNTRFITDEGLVQLPDGRIVGSLGARLYFYDSELNPLSRDERDASTGAHLLRPISGAWDSRNNQHLLLAFPEDSAFGIGGETQVAAVPLLLSSYDRLFDFEDNDESRIRRLTYLPEEDLIAIALFPDQSHPPEIALYDHGGVLVERTNIAAVGAPTGAFAYIPSTREFAVSTIASPRKLQIVTRAGVPTRTIDFSPLGIRSIVAATYFNASHPSGGQFLVVTNEFAGAEPRILITDFNGRLISEFNYRRELGLLGVIGVAAITTGPQAGAFTAIDPEASELVVFRLDSSNQ